MSSGGGKGSTLPDWTDPLGVHNLGGGSLDPLNAYASNQPGGANYQAKMGPQTPTSIPTLSGGMTGQMPGGIPAGANPNSWGMPTPQGGFWNQIAQQMAGPVYTGGLQIPGVSPAMANQPIGGFPPPPQGQSAGKGGMLQALGNTLPGSMQQQRLQAGGLRNGFTHPGSPMLQPQAF